MIDLEEKARHIRELILTALAEAGSGRLPRLGRYFHCIVFQPFAP